MNHMYYVRLLTLCGTLFVVAVCPALRCKKAAATEEPTAPAKTAAVKEEHPAITPVPRASDGWKGRNALLNRRAEQDKGEAEVIFIGDSITDAWEREGKDIWKKYYAPRKALNLAIGGDYTQQVLWRLERGNLEGVRPKLAVILIGVNNAASKEYDYSATEIAQGITRIVALVRQKLPDTKILLLGIFPYRERPCPERGIALQVNQIIRKLDDGSHVHYLDIGHHFIDADGVISRDIMPDFVHLSPAGYKLWASLMERKITELLRE